MKPSLPLTAGAVALALALPAFASILPEPQTLNGITYLSGGIGQDEAAAMKAEAKRYPLSIIFSEGRHDAYVANAKVTIADASGKTVLDAVSVGPIMLVKLPAGRYRISAMAAGKTLQREAQVKAKGDEQVLFHWSKIA
jgi:hypothetical protein